MTFVNDIPRCVSELHRAAERRAIVCTAFCRAEAFLRVFGVERATLPIQKLVVRWRRSDLVQGVSDFDTYFEAVRRGWEVYASFDLHAKCYVFDNQIVLGSANLTGAGLGEQGRGNYELSALMGTDGQFDRWFETVSAASIRLNDEIVDAMRREVEASVPDHRGGDAGFSAETMALIYRSGAGFDLFTADFPWSNCPAHGLPCKQDREVRRDHEHDLLLFPGLRYGGPDVTRDQFLRSKCWKWLVSNVSRPCYFGELSAQLHADLCDDPAPFRKDVKALLGNLLSWSEWLLPDLVAIDRPRHSQRVRLLF